MKSMVFRVLILLSTLAVSASCSSDDERQPAPQQDAGDDVGSPDMDEAMFGLTKIEPATGNVQGGTTVQLRGGGFQTGMTVRFGDTPATDVVVMESGSARAVTPPAEMIGAVTVTVENPDGAIDSILNGFTYVESQDPSIDFCQLQAQSPVTAISGEPVDTIFAVVFAQGLTPGEGQGDFIEGQLGFGMGAQYESFDFVEMSYNVDKNGLEPGDLANDEYGASLTIPVAGEYRYVARFRTEQRPNEWTYCDLDGSENGVSADQLGIIQITDPGVNLPDACNLQFPEIVPDAEVGGTYTVFGRITESGITGSGAADPSLEGELLVGPSGSDPQADPGAFQSIQASVHNNAINLDPAEDEYTADFSPTQVGTYVFAYRFSVDGGQNWAYCDLDGNDSSSGFDLDRVGYLEVSPQAPELIDYCRVWQTNLSTTTQGSSPVVTVEIFEDPLTVNNAGSNAAQLEVEVGYGPDGVNPALDGTFAWNPTPLPFKAVGPSQPNNYEYEGAIYPDTDKPTTGNYDVVVRVRESGSSLWTHCDTDETTMEFRVEATTELLVNP